ncbi:MAG TPA: chemotaxis protein CheA [Blastocatellia bacterium]|nr:chemotaxis protein CheA [Blastocatellia bacterium]
MDDRAREEFDQLLAVFREQSLQILEEMGHDLLALESGADADAATRLRRGAHTIKGDSACVGLDGLTNIAHSVEDAFDAVLGGEVALDRPSVDLILRCLDAIRDAIGGADVGDVPADVGDRLVGELRRIRKGRAAGISKRASAAAKRSELERPDRTSTAYDGVTAKQRRDYVRVEAAKVDALLNLAGEMVIARSVIGQFSPELERALPRSELVNRFGCASGQLGKLIGELQKSVLKMRMVTIDQVFRRFARPMRELAAERGKEIQIEFSGGETELDRALVDSLYEPLLHTLRNAVDHGIEPPEERTKAGKPAIGRISMRAYHQGNQVVVEVSDDGRGIDASELKAKALLAGAMSKEEVDAVPEEEAADLIFLEGVSTAKKVTRLSGRGIGAAAVKSAIEQLRGSVSVKSERGRGTCFVLRMPLTLAIIRALLFNASGQLFAVPLLDVSEIARVKASDIVVLDGIENFRLRDRFISVVRPGTVLSFDRRKGGSGAALRPEPDYSFIIVLAVAERRFGILAQELIGEQEIVIKPLDNQWVQNDALAGASVLGDGRVALIMDAEMVFRKAAKYERGKANSKEAAYAG